MNISMLMKFNNYSLTNKWHLPSKLKIIIEHIIFLLFPFIIEYLSFIYYIYFFPDEFIIKNNLNQFITYIFIILGSILIIIYNIENYIDIICLNKIYTTTLFDAYLKVNNEKKAKNNKPIAYKTSNFIIYFIIFLQNFPILLSFNNYLNKDYKMHFKITISIILLLVIILICFYKINKFNYSNLINILIMILFLFCIYSIIFDCIIFISNYRIEKDLVIIIYVLLTIFLSFITYLLFKIKI